MDGIGGVSQEQLMLAFVDFNVAFLLQKYSFILLFIE